MSSVPTAEAIALAGQTTGQLADRADWVALAALAALGVGRRVARLALAGVAQRRLADPERAQHARRLAVQAQDAQPAERLGAVRGGERERGGGQAERHRGIGAERKPVAGGAG